MCEQNRPTSRLEYLTSVSSLTVRCQNMIGNTADKIAIGTWRINGLLPEVVDCGWNRDQVAITLLISDPRSGSTVLV